MTEAPRQWGRRRLLQTGAVALGGAGTGWTAAAIGLPDRASSSPVGATDAGADAVGVPRGNRTVPFHGAHQAGVVTIGQTHLSLLGIDLEPGVDADGLTRLLRVLSDDAARLTRGLPALADTEPELAGVPASLSVTFGLGPRLGRFLEHAEVAPRPLPAFSTDRLDDAWGQTDLAVQLCADDPLTLTHARRMLLKDMATLGRLVWIQHGYREAVETGTSGNATRNVMGQVDGTENPQPTDANFEDLIWSTKPGFEGGTYMVVRRIRAEMETWDKVDRHAREAAVGRRLDNGAPLTGSVETDQPDFEAIDDLGLPVIDPASHIARARSGNARERILRRPYNYTVPDPTRPTGEDSGLVFVAFCADVEHQFVPIQRRLAALDRLNQWITTIGSAVYAVPPGAVEGGFVGQGLCGAREARCCRRHRRRRAPCPRRAGGVGAREPDRLRPGRRLPHPDAARAHRLRVLRRPDRTGVSRGDRPRRRVRDRRRGGGERAPRDPVPAWPRGGHLYRCDSSHVRRWAPGHGAGVFRRWNGERGRRRR